MVQAGKSLVIENGASGALLGWQWFHMGMCFEKLSFPAEYVDVWMKMGGVSVSREKLSFIIILKSALLFCVCIG